MNNEWSIDIFTRNLKKYMEQSGKNQKEMAAIVGVSAPTFHDWLKGNKMPRMANVQKLADYFGVNLSDLIEDNSFAVEQAIFEAKILKDKELMDMVKLYLKLDKKNKRAVRQMVEALSAE